MNDTATRLLAQLDVRQKLLLSLRQPEGCYVQARADEPDGLYWGWVDQTMALVPVEHAQHIPQTAIAAMRMRGLAQTAQGIPGTFIPLTVAIGEALQDIEAARAWIREGGGG